jgi:hypothetical protein
VIGFRMSISRCDETPLLIIVLLHRDISSLKQQKMQELKVETIRIAKGGGGCSTYLSLNTSVRPDAASN